MYECFHCLHMSVIWGADFDYKDFGLDGEGVVHTLQCMNCGAEITYSARSQPKMKNRSMLKRESNRKRKGNDNVHNSRLSVRH